MHQIQFVKTNLLICSDVTGLRDFPEHELLALAEKVKLNGMTRGLSVVPAGELFDVKKGIKLWKAAVLAGLSEVPVIVETADESVDDYISNKSMAWLLENTERNSFIPWANKIATISNILAQPPASVFPQLAVLECLFDVRGLPSPSVSEKEQLTQLRKQYSSLKRRLNKESKARQKYLVDCGNAWLKIGFKFEGHWFCCKHNPPEPLVGVKKVWVMPVGNELDPNVV